MTSSPPSPARGGPVQDCVLTHGVPRLQETVHLVLEECTESVWTFSDDQCQATVLSVRGNVLRFCCSKKVDCASFEDVVLLCRLWHLNTSPISSAKSESIKWDTNTLGGRRVTASRVSNEFSMLVIMHFHANNRCNLRNMPRATFEAKIDMFSHCGGAFTP